MWLLSHKHKTMYVHNEMKIIFVETKGAFSNTETCHSILIVTTASIHFSYLFLPFSVMDESWWGLP